MNKATICIWGRDFNLDIEFEKYSGEIIQHIQEKALNNFLASSAIIDDSKSSVEQYCLKWNKEDIGSDKIDNIFKYVKPKSLYVLRANDNTRTIAIMCAYKFYSDNRIAIVFKNEHFDRVVIDDEII